MNNLVNVDISVLSLVIIVISLKNRIMTTLKEAQEKDKLKDFIKEHKKDPKSDKEKFDKLMQSIASQIQLKDPQASSQDENEN